MRHRKKVVPFLAFVLLFCGGGALAYAQNPAQLIWGTYLGGTNFEEATAITVDATGAAYLGGRTRSPEYPVTPGAYDTTLSGIDDGVLVKLSATGHPIFATFLGGSGGETIYDVLVDDSGNIYVSGTTTSADFPTTPGAFDETYNGNGDIFVAKFNPTGDTLLFSTLIGGNNNELTFESCLAIDATGALYVGGSSISWDFPVTPGAFKETKNGGGDGFVVKLAPDGSSVSYATFLGGNADDQVRALAVNSSGEVYVRGGTSSGDFPVTSGAYDETYNGNSDWFVAKLDAAGSSLVYATYLGGSNQERPNVNLLLTATGEVYVSGSTYSSDFPTTPGAYDQSFSIVDGFDVVTAKLSATGADLLASTFAFGGGFSTTGLASDSSGNLWCVIGAPAIMESQAVTTPGAYRIERTGSAAIVASMDADLTQLLYSSYIEGSNNLENFVALGPSGSVYGWIGTTGSGWPATPGAFDPSYNGDRDGFVFKLDPTASASWYTPVGTDVLVTPDAGLGVSLTFDTVSVPGNTTVSASTTPPAAGPAGLMFLGTYYDINTASAYSGPISICVPYDDAGMTLAQEQALALLHWDSDSMEWVNITSSVDTSNNVVCGVTTSFSVFALAVVPAFEGFLAPINMPPAEMSVFKLKSTVPVKFRLIDPASGLSVANAQATIWAVKVSNGVPGDVNEPLVSTQPDGGTSFRYDGGQYIFNLGTRNLGQGVYRIHADILGGLMDRWVDIAIK